MAYDEKTKYGIYVDIVTYSDFERARIRLGLTQTQYLQNLMGEDYTGVIKRRVDIHQTRLYAPEELKIDKR